MAGVLDVISSIEEVVFQEIPAGTQDGVNPSFTLLFAPTPQVSLELNRNGILLSPGTGNDFTLSGQLITFLGDQIPQSTDNIRATYNKF